MSRSRSAEASYKGYTYQRARLLNLIFTKYYTGDDINTDIYISEETEEDISFSEEEKNMEVYQLKYLSSNKAESISKSSGLIKVLLGNYKTHDNIDKIYYEVVTTSSKGKTKQLEYFLELIDDDQNNYLMTKFFKINFNDKDNFFSKNTTYNDLIEKLKNDENISENENENYDKINKFILHYDNQTDPNKNVIQYLKKLDFKIKITNFEKIHEETIEAIKSKINSFKNKFESMSKEYIHFHSEAIYGFMNILVNNNLFDKNERIKLVNIIKKIKDKINTFETVEDRHIILFNTIQFFYSGNCNNITNTILKNDFIISYIIENKLTITNFILKNKIIKFSNEFNQLIRIIIYKIIQKIDYEIHDDKKLTSFLLRSFDKLKLTGKIYTTLKKIDEKILKYNNIPTTS